MICDHKPPKAVTSIGAVLIIIGKSQVNCTYESAIFINGYFVKFQASDQLITDDAKTELVKESQVHLLDLNPMETAAQIMVCFIFFTVG